jgi:type I restriction enzyme S subunit
VIADLKPYPAYKAAGLPWLDDLPVHWDTRRLRHACEMRVSNVDKHTERGETPVRLCNYVDVYKNERIRGSLRFMSATASEDERIRFHLRTGDVVITKDSNNRGSRDWFVRVVTTVGLQETTARECTATAPAGGVAVTG